MATSNANFYSLNDFNNILFESFQYTLSNDVQDIIKSLSLKLGIPMNKEREKDKDREKQSEYQKPRSHRRNLSSFNRTNSESEESWAQLRTFKATVVEKKTEGVEKTMSEIRSCLNKISTKNYDTKKNEIIEYINSLFLGGHLDDSDEIQRKHREEIEKIANNIFDIASTNKFFSELYAELYKSLIEHFEIFKYILDKFIENFTDTMHGIKYVEPNDDYDKFCAYNKSNDMRKSTAVFIVNLVKKGVLEPNYLLKICMKTLSIVVEYINESNRVNEVEEITENIFLLITQSHSELKCLSEWDSILKDISLLSQLKVKDKPSISSRAIFKYMDIMDKIKNQK
jgi:hypothetical protein